MCWHFLILIYKVVITFMYYILYIEITFIDWWVVSMLALFNLQGGDHIYVLYIDIMDEYIVKMASLFC